MQKVTGVEQSKDILSKNRGLDLEGDPKYISQFSEAIFGEKLSLLDYVKEILAKVKTDGDKAIYDLSSKIDGQNLKQVFMDYSRWRMVRNTSCLYIIWTKTPTFVNPDICCRL